MCYKEDDITLMYFFIYLQQACGKYIPAGSTVQGNQTGVAMDGTYLVEASF